MMWRCWSGEILIRSWTSSRYAFPWWREKEILSDQRRSQGLCPLTPEEAALTLQALGFNKETQIYIAAGEIYGSERRLATLREAFPMIVSTIIISSAQISTFSCEFIWNISVRQLAGNSIVSWSHLHEFSPSGATHLENVCVHNYPNLISIICFYFKLEFFFSFPRKEKKKGKKENSLCQEKWSYRVIGQCSNQESGV